jgi:hypothetical protein
VAGEETATLRRGESLLAPRGVPHSYAVTSEEGARWLVVTSPGGFDRFVEAVGRPAESETLPPPAAPDVERLAAIAAAHGIELVGPPPALAQSVR